MRYRVVVAAGVAAVLVALISGAPGAAGQKSAAKNTAPRTAWGKPDLQGVWDFRTITPFERPKDLAGREFLTEAEAARLEQETEERNEELLVRPAERTQAGGNVDWKPDGSPGFYNNFWLDSGTKTTATRRTSLIVDPTDGRLPPMTANAQQKIAARQRYLKEHPADSWLDRSTADRCLLGFNAGPPINPSGYNQNLQIFQTPTHVGLLTEMVHTARIVPLDGRPAISDTIRQWSGTSRGRWEGDTLVVETSNFREDRGWRSATGNVKLVERFTRVDADLLQYTYTVTDPDTWTRPWTATVEMRRGELPLYEYACHEGNYSLPNILSGHRAEEKRR